MSNVIKFPMNRVKPSKGVINFDNRVYRMAWIVRNSDNRGDIWVEAFRREADAIFSRSVRGGRIIRGFFKAAPEEI